MKNIKALARSTAATVWLIVFMTILGEKSSPFKNFLASLAGHHWVTKGVFALAFFIISYFALSAAYKGKPDIKKETRHVIISSVAGSMVILLFFALEFIGLL